MLSLWLWIVVAVLSVVAAIISIFGKAFFWISEWPLLALLHHLNYTASTTAAIMHRTSTALLSHASHCCMRSLASSSSSSSSSLMIASPRLHGQRSISTTAGALKNTSLSSSIRHSRQYATSPQSAGLQKTPARQQQQADAVQKQQQGDNSYGTFAGPAMHTLGVATRELDGCLLAD